MSSLPLRERGLKLCRKIKQICERLVAPLAGAWIETRSGCRIHHIKEVAPLAGAWIETDWILKKNDNESVAPLAGAWIETWHYAEKFEDLPSLPLRERGLKQTSGTGTNGQQTRRSPCGSVD